MLNDWLLLLAAGLLSGVINSVAGGGTFIAYPALLAMGISPIMSNATISLVIQPGSASSAFGYRKFLRDMPNKYYWLIVPCVVGSLLGAGILTRTSNHNFAAIVPYFILFAVGLLILQPFLYKELFSNKGLKLQRKYPRLLTLSSILGFFLVSIYGGYFGAGFGIIALGFLGMTSLKDINQMNGLKNILGLSIGTVNAAYFVAHKLIAWQVVPLFVVGNVIGGYYGAKYLSKLPAKVIRATIIAIGLSLAIALFMQL